MIGRFGRFDLRFFVGLLFTVSRCLVFKVQEDAWRNLPGRCQDDRSLPEFEKALFVLVLLIFGRLIRNDLRSFVVALRLFGFALLRFFGDAFRRF